MRAILSMFRRSRSSDRPEATTAAPPAAPGAPGAVAPPAPPLPAPPEPPHRRRFRGKSLEFDHVDTQTLDSQIHEWVGHTRPRLGEVLLDLGSVDPDDLLEALQRQREAPDDQAAKARLGEILLELGKIDEIALAAALASQFGVPLADLAEARVSPEAVARVPEELARKHGVLPLHLEDGRVFLASADPLNTDAIEELTRHCRSIGLLIGPRSAIERLIDQSYNPLQTADDVIRAFELTDAAAEVSAADDQFQVDENAPVVQVANRILTQGVRSRASDIHIEPAESYLKVRYRVDGAMTEAIRLPARMGPALISRVKVMAELNIVERRRPQDGQFSVRVDGRPIDIRCSVVPTVHGEKAVMRLLDKTKSLMSMKDLGMIPAVEQPFIKLAKAPLGMILCTGPTGSGKTTTLYAALTEVNDPTKNVVTIEDPVEYQFEGISQMQISHTGMTFAEGLRGILRQDPDVILVGEIRDEETARIAMQAALTGHLVLSSMHAIDAVSALNRFMDMGIEPFLVSSAVNGVVAQRLLRRLCNACKEPTTPTTREINAVAEHTDGQLPDVWFAPKGCNMCNGTGYRGRIGVYELLELTERIRELVVGRAHYHEISRAAIEDGMKTMQEQAFMLVTDGVTTVEEVLRSVYAPNVEEHVEPLALGPGKRELPRGNGVLPPVDDGATVDLSGDGDVLDVRPRPMGPVNGSAGTLEGQPADVEATA
jgi:type IV pilus assembly protein PilB